MEGVGWVRGVAWPELLKRANIYPLLQMTSSQAESWTLNANQYVADEEDETFTTRVSAELLLDELHEVLRWYAGSGDACRQHGVA